MAWSTADQALSSGSNFVLVFLLARGTTPAELGILFIGYAILGVGLAVCRSAFGAILGLDLPRLAEREAGALLGLSITSVVLISLPLSGSLLLYGGLVPGTDDATGALLILAVAVPVLLLQDLQRYWAVAVGKPQHAAAADAVWLLVAVSGFWLADMVSSSLQATSGAALWLGGAIAAHLALVMLGYWRRPRRRGWWGWIRRDTRRRHLASDALLGQFSPLLASGAIALIGGPNIIAAIRGAATIFGPLNLVGATIPLALVPEAIRSTPRRAARLFLITSVGFGLMSLAWGLLAHLVPEAVGTALLGDTFPLVQAIILITAIEYVGLGVWGVARARLHVQGRIKTALQLRVAFTVATAILPITAVLLFGDAKAVAISLAIITACLGLAAYAVSRLDAPSPPIH